MVAFQKRAARLPVRPAAAALICRSTLLDARRGTQAPECGASNLILQEGLIPGADTVKIEVVSGAHYEQSRTADRRYERKSRARDALGFRPDQHTFRYSSRSP